MRECDALLAAGRKGRDRLSSWVTEHHHEAARSIIDTLDGVGHSLTGKRVADIGCGDGLVDLGLVDKARPGELVGYDIERTDEAKLLEMARRVGVGRRLPRGLRFEESTETTIPADDASFDYVVSWSVFEHATDPITLALEMRRILRPTGLVFVQLYPFYMSEHGSHLWDWFPDGFEQFQRTDDEIEQVLRSDPGPLGPGWAEEQLHIYRTLNRLTLDDLQRAIVRGGLRIIRVELITNRFHVPLELAHLPLSDLSIGGVKLLAQPR
jgi:ubiquinone/menaquinone biosynthesis C-methylase UbiE